MNPLKLLEKAINEHGSANIIRDRLATVKDMLSDAEKERSNLNIKLSELEKENKHLRTKLSKLSVPDDFQEFRGALFKKDPSGGYFPDAYCRECNSVMSQVEGFLPLLCTSGKCSVSTSFMKHELSSVIDKLTSNQ